MGLKQMPADRYDITWLNCVTGKTVKQRGVPVSAGDQSWAPPDGIRGEVVLHVRRRPVANRRPDPEEVVRCPNAG